MERKTLLEWDKRQDPDNRIALGIDAQSQVWIAERKGSTIELSTPDQGVVHTVDAPLTDAAHPGWSLPRLAGSWLLHGSPAGLHLGDRVVLRGQFQCYDGAVWQDSCVLLASGTPEGKEPGVYWIHWLPGDTEQRVERVGDPASGVSVSHDAERIGLAWCDERGVHTVGMGLRDREGVQSRLISYYAPPTERYTAPSVAVDQTGKAYALFYVFTRNEQGALAPSREMQLNFERIAFKASATADGYFPVNLIHRKRIYMVYGAKPDSTTARWRVPGTTMWDGAEHIPGGYPAAVTDGKTLYIATNKGLWTMGTGSTDEGLDLLSHSWASPEGDEGPRNTFGAKLRRWLGF